MQLGEAWEEAAAAASIVVSLFFICPDDGGSGGEVRSFGEAGNLSILLKISTYVGITTSMSGRKNCPKPKYPFVVKITARAL